MHDTTEGCCGTEESIGARGDAWYVGLAGSEEFRMGKRFVESLNQDTDHPPEGGPNCHGRYEYACRHLATIGNDDKKSSHDRGE